MRYALGTKVRVYFKNKHIGDGVVIKNEFVAQGNRHLYEVRFTSVTDVLSENWIGDGSYFSHEELTPLTNGLAELKKRHNL